MPLPFQSKVDEVRPKINNLRKWLSWNLVLIAKRLRPDCPMCTSFYAEDIAEKTLHGIKIVKKEERKTYTVCVDPATGYVGEANFEPGDIIQYNPRGHQPFDALYLPINPVWQAELLNNPPGD